VGVDTDTDMVTPGGVLCESRFGDEESGTGVNPGFDLGIWVDCDDVDAGAEGRRILGLAFVEGPPEPDGRGERIRN